MVATVDDSDDHLVSGIKWRAAKKSPSKTWYVVAIIDGKKWTLHQWLQKSSPFPKTDHKDGNGLNNKRDNLRPCTHSQNMANRGLDKSNRSGFKGVHWKKREQRWHSEITCQNKRYDGGYYKNIKDAILAYDSLSNKLFGEFSRPNLPKIQPC